jgi:hypothetical protein
LVTGIQHPTPHLICSVERSTNGVNAAAPFAVTVYNGNRLFKLGQDDPQTRMRFLLYTQVLQADAASNSRQNSEARLLSFYDSYQLSFFSCCFDHR